MTPLHHHEPTSVAAADSMIDQAETDRATVYAAYLQHGAMTPDECAARVGWGSDVYRARRRCTELKQDGRLRETGDTRRTAKGRKAAVLVVADRQRRLF